MALARRARPRSPISVPSGVGVLVMRGSAQRTHLAVLVATLALACRAGSRPAPGGGLRVVDDAGRTVALAGPARRIVSLSPAITELVFALGAGERLVGRTTWCDYPPAARAVPSVGDGLNPSVEAVAAAIPGALWCLFPRSSATPFLEEAERYRVVLGDFLAQVETRPFASDGGDAQDAQVDTRTGAPDMGDHPLLARTRRDRAGADVILGVAQRIASM